MNRNKYRQVKCPAFGAVCLLIELRIRVVYLYLVCGVDFMGMFEKEIDITRNIKMIEWLKSELLTDVANLYKVLVNGMKEEIHESVSETLSNIILICYLLGRRLGISYNAIEMKMENKVKLGLIENHDVEKYYGDLSELAKHLNSSRLKKKEF